MLAASCPWSSLLPSPAEFCERSLCAWIRQPGNTASNVGFLAVAVVLYGATRAPSRRHLRGIAHVSLATAVGSAFFHASETYWGELLDYLGMLGAMGWMLAACATRWRALSRGA